MLSLYTSYTIIGNYDKAFEILQDSILQNENNPYLHEVLEKQAELLFDMGDLEQAILSYENFLSKEINPAQKCRILNSLNGLYMAHTDLSRTEGEKENKFSFTSVLGSTFCSFTNSILIVEVGYIKPPEKALIKGRNSLSEGISVLLQEKSIAWRIKNSIK
jgi:tetratricopeptide (TPR) repeat protein